jgi:hypothetical protein
VTVRLSTIYGSPYKEGKDEFISEMHELFRNWEERAMIGGDFNLVRHECDKSNGVVDFKWVDIINAWVTCWLYFRLVLLVGSLLGVITKVIEL